MTHLWGNWSRIILYDVVRTLPSGRPTIWSNVIRCVRITAPLLERGWACTSIHYRGGGGSGRSAIERISGRQDPIWTECCRRVRPRTTSRNGLPSSPTRSFSSRRSSPKSSSPGSKRRRRASIVKNQKQSRWALPTTTEKILTLCLTKWLNEYERMCKTEYNYKFWQQAFIKRVWGVKIILNLINFFKLVKLKIYFKKSKDLNIN